MTQVTLARLYELRNLLRDYPGGDLVLGPLDLRDLRAVLARTIQLRERFREALGQVVAESVQAGERPLCRPGRHRRRRRSRA